MTGTTDDPNDPRIKRGGADETPVPQNDAYLVLSEAERAKGFVRPVRRSYVHVGMPGPKYPLRKLTIEEHERHDKWGYIRYEEYPQPNPDGSSILGKFWTQKELDSKGCKTVTTMGTALAETYARQPEFYGSTYCVTCRMHRPVGAAGEFVWDGTNERVGT